MISKTSWTDIDLTCRAVVFHHTNSKFKVTNWSMRRAAMECKTPVPHSVLTGLPRRKGKILGQKVYLLLLCGLIFHLTLWFFFPCSPPLCSHCLVSPVPIIHSWVLLRLFGGVLITLRISLFYMYLRGYLSISLEIHKHTNNTLEGMFAHLRTVMFLSCLSNRVRLRVK